jgi:hypothetical protein
MNAGRITPLKRKGRGQAMVEFLIALPILLFVIIGIIEFARMVFSWLAVQNAARFGIRYAVTGEFDDIYCIEAGGYLGAVHANADMFGGDPQDCRIPDAYPGTDSNELEQELIDIARLFSIQDATLGGGSGLWLRPNVSGNYAQYLANHDEAFIGLPDEKGFYHVTICSNRAGQFAMDFFNYSIPLCFDNLNSRLMDDAGGPGDRVKVRVEHEHPLFLPLLSNIWPSVTLSAERDAIVEKFRVSRVAGVSGPILSAPTWTLTPTITLTPTVTDTPSITPTPTITDTPVPVDCDLISIDSSFFGNLGGGFSGARVRIKNDNPVPIHLFQADVNWDKIPPSRFLEAMRFNFSPLSILNDPTPPTSWIPGVPIELAALSSGDYYSLFKPLAVPLQGDISIDLEFEDSCIKSVADNIHTVTPSFTPSITLTPTITDTPTLVPTPDCSLYSLSAFTFANGAVQRLTVTNGDVVDTTVSSIQFNWDFAESFGAANGYPNLNVDWFSWNGTRFYLGGNDDLVRDLDSPTNWIGGSRPFNNGTSYTWAIDFDGDWGSGGPLTGVVSNDFGVIIDFANGCQLRRDPVPRTIISWTPTDTPTSTGSPTPTSTFTDTPIPTWTPACPFDDPNWPCQPTWTPTP